MPRMWEGFYAPNVGGALRPERSRDKPAPTKGDTPVDFIALVGGKEDLDLQSPSDPQADALRFW